MAPGRGLLVPAGRLHRTGVLAKTNDEMDELHASLMAELASGRMAPPVMMQMTLVARFYQRLADHAVNIARRTSYLAGSPTERATGIERA